MRNGEASKRIDFSANAAVYDRRHGALLPAPVARALTARLKPCARILDVGAGTGRVSVALAELGFEVIAIDPAIPMLRTLREKAGTLPLQCIAAEGPRLPFSNGIVEAVVISRLLYLVRDWKQLLHAVSDVLVRGGAVLHEWGNGRGGEPWVLVREKARALFEEAGVQQPFHPGARTEQEVEQCLADLGFCRTGQAAAGPGMSMSLQDFIGKIESGEVSYIWKVPQEVRDACLPALRVWAEKEFDVGKPMPMPAALEWSIFERSV